MKTTIFTSLCVLVLLASELCWAAQKTCSTRVLRQATYTFDVDKIFYRLCILERYGNTFHLRIKNANINGTTIIESPWANQIMADGDLFTFELNDMGKKQMKRSRWYKLAFITINDIFVRDDGVTFPRTVKPDLKLVEFINGNFSCKAPNFPPPKMKVCKQLANIGGTCGCKKITVVKNYSGSQRGYLKLDVNRLLYQELTIGLSSKVKNFKTYFIKTSSECNTTYHFSRGLHRVNEKKRFTYIWYHMEFDADTRTPEIQYISFGNKMCRTSCGIKPVCATPLPQTTISRPRVTTGGESSPQSVLTTTDAVDLPTTANTEAVYLTTTANTEAVDLTTTANTEALDLPTTANTEAVDLPTTANTEAVDLTTTANTDAVALPTTATTESVIEASVPTETQPTTGATTETDFPGLIDILEDEAEAEIWSEFDEY